MNNNGEPPAVPINWYGENLAADVGLFVLRFITNLHVGEEHG